MNVYALIKIIDAVDGVDARKRLQKGVFLIQASGCNLGAKYLLHLYGPYSRDVADATDKLTQAGYLEEQPNPQPWGTQFAYKVSDRGKEEIAAFEGSPEGKKRVRVVARYVQRFKELSGMPLWTLELAATIAYYRCQAGLPWKEAVEKTAAFKRLKKSASVLSKASDVAREFVSVHSGTRG